MLESQEWRHVAEKIEAIIPVETLSEICQAHGEDEEFLSNESLNEDEFEEVDGILRDFGLLEDQEQ